MNQAKWYERIQKRELRTIYRDRRIEYEREKRNAKSKNEEKKEKIKKNADAVLHEEKKKRVKQDKKPGAEKFLSMYSYIPSTPFDIRYSIPSSWKPYSFNGRNQHLEFIKRFIYPYPISETLLWATHEPENAVDYIGAKLIRLAKKWVADITCGKSFYKQNKTYFTKAEAHYFLSAKIPYEEKGSVIKMYFYAKCRARAINHKLSMIIADVFTVKFYNNYGFMNSLVNSFLDLIARTPDYRYERGMLGDLCDFVLVKMNENKRCRKNRTAFTFSGRTIFSVIGLVNKWHKELREEENLRRERVSVRHGEQKNRKNENPLDTSHWKGLGISQFQYKTDECIWTVTELLSAKALLNEGQKMKNCIASYYHRCAAGDCSIFTLECVYPISGIVYKKATLEVSPSNRVLLQAKGKCNTAVTQKTTAVINRWAAASGITVRLSV